MSELPEVAVLADQLKVLEETKIISVKIYQPKCLNITPELFTTTLVGSSFKEFKYKGKWLIMISDNYSLYLNYGMGADIIYSNRENTNKQHLLIKFENGYFFTIRVHFVAKFDLIFKGESHKSYFDGENANEISVEYFLKLAKGSRASVKSFILNQKNISGIGNFYQHDILFLSNTHPQTKISKLSTEQLTNLHTYIAKILNKSISLKGDAYYLDLYGIQGGFSKEYFLVAYKVNQPCPVCSTLIKKIKTGSSTSYICPTCQDGKVTLNYTNKSVK